MSVCVEICNVFLQQEKRIVGETQRCVQLKDQIRLLYH